MLITPWMTNKNESFKDETYCIERSTPIRTGRNELSIQEVDDSEGSPFVLYNVSLVSELISDKVAIYGEDTNIKTGVFLKIVHQFTGKVDKRIDGYLSDRQQIFDHMILYPQISHVTSLIDNSGISLPDVDVIEISQEERNRFQNEIEHINAAIRNIGCTFWRYSEKDNNFVQMTIRPNNDLPRSILNVHSPVYSHTTALALKALDIVPTNNDTKGIEEASALTVFFDIPDPRYPSITLYNPGNIPKAIQFKSQFTASEIKSCIRDLDIKWCERNLSFNQDEYNSNLRRAIMSLPGDDSSDYEDWFDIIVTRLLIRNIAIDYNKIALLNMVEESTVICLVTIGKTLASNPSNVKINVKKLVNPFKQQHTILRKRFELSMQTLEYTILESMKHNHRVTRYLTENVSVAQFRIIIHDCAYETIIKLTDLQIKENSPLRSVTFSISKAESTKDYVLEYLNRANSMAMVNK